MTNPDHLMFGINPGSIKAGKESEAMPWLRAWRPTFNYVSKKAFRSIGLFRQLTRE
jgi:hypothetical protein